jgi:hypothetical protein
MTTEPPRQILALLDDAALAAQVIEMSSALAQHMRRPLEVVYVESAAALLAAALPFTQVLRPGGAQWTPFEPGDVERGYRSQAARLRALIERVTLGRTVDWSMRVMRGALPEAAIEGPARSDLMLVAGAARAQALAPVRWPGRRRRSVVVALADESAAGERAREVAEQAARALDAALTVRRLAGEAGASAPRLDCDLLVLPRSLALRSLLARLIQPALLVG